MARILKLQLDGAALDFEARRVLVAGYTGRDAAQVRAHIAELERQGIPAPPSVPTAYVLDASFALTATKDEEITLGAARVSGEAEPALLFPTHRLEDALVSVISDFTDREEERRSIAQSKLQPKPLSSQAPRDIRMSRVLDEIALRSWVTAGGQRPFYQSGKLAQLSTPRELLQKLNAVLNISSDLQGTVLLMGTLPLLTKEFSFSHYFACEMERRRKAPGYIMSAGSAARRVRNSPQGAIKQSVIEREVKVMRTGRQYLESLSDGRAVFLMALG